MSISECRNVTVVKCCDGFLCASVSVRQCVSVSIRTVTVVRMLRDGFLCAPVSVRL